MTSRIKFITEGVKIMAKRITRRTTKKPTTKSITTKKPNTNKTVNSPAARKRNPKPGSVNRVQQRRKLVSNRVTPKRSGPSGRVGSVAAARKNTGTGISKQKRPNVNNNKAVQNAAKKVSRFGLPGKIAAIGTLLGGTAFMTKKKKDPTFGEAFKKARKEKGPMSSFNYKGKKYSTVTKDQVEKAGYSTLRQYLNAGGKKKTAAKPKRKKTGPRNRR